MEKWLYDILWDGTLVDNQIYRAHNGILKNHRLSENIDLCIGGRKEWLDSRVWANLVNLNYSIKEILSKGKEGSIILFNNHEYEHNTEDDFISVSGIDARNFELKTSNLIGQIVQGDYYLKIGSRFGNKFLQYIISDADGFLEIENYGGNNADEGYEWLLIYLWKTKLKKAFRLGLPKSYETKKERLTKVRGNVDIIDYYINQNLGAYNCTYREHSYQNSAAMLISAVFNLWKEHSFLDNMHNIRSAFVNASRGQKAPFKELMDTPYFSNPFYSEYNKVIDLSKLLIRNKSANFGQKDTNSAFFFDVSMLFEYFIKKLLIRNGFKVKSKSTLELTIPSGTYDRKLEPDLTFETLKGLFVFDVKYKNFDFRYGVSREDLFQIHTYVAQATNIGDIKGCGFIYPILNTSKEVVIEKSFKIMGKDIPFYVCFLHVPEESDDFAKNFTASCNKFIQELSLKTN